MERGTLETLKHRKPQKYQSLIQSLNEDDRWMRFLETLDNMSIASFLHYDTIRRNKSPSSLLLEELGVRLCTVENFRAILKKSDLMDTLAIVSKHEPLLIVKQPESDAGCEQHGPVGEKCRHVPYGDELVLVCEAVGLPPPRYQWYCDNSLLEGFTRPRLAVPRFKAENVGEYYCIVSQKKIGGPETRKTSHYVVCKVMHSLPEFSKKQIKHLKLEVDAKLQLSVDIKCKSPYVVQWYKDTTLLQGETSTTLTKKNVSLQDVGAYRCLASNEAGDVWSIPIDLEVDATPSPTSKLALLIGNSNYDKFDDLMTPCNDIVLLAENFKKLDFQVLALIDLTSEEMKTAIDLFFEMVSQDSYVVICFIGHGFKYQARNYMMPVDCGSFEEGPTIFDSAICDELLVQKAHGKEVGLLLLIMDMCLEEFLTESSPMRDHSEHYVYEPYCKCHVIRLYSTGPYQRAYEVSGQTNGCYIRHISGYIFEDQPLIRLAVKVNEKFWQSGMANHQSPHFTIMGGQAMKLTTPPLESGMEINKLHSVSKIPVNFPGAELIFQIGPHNGHISNAVDVLYPKLPIPCSFTCQVPEDLKCGTSECLSGVTIYNLQKVESDVSVIIHLKIMHSNDTYSEESAVMNLPFPFIAKLLNDFSSST